MTLKDIHSMSNFDEAEIRHIDFEFSIDFENRLIGGTAKYHLNRQVEGYFSLDTLSLSILEMHSEKGPLTWSLEPVSKLLGTRLVIDDLKGAAEFWIKFETGPEATALQWLTPKQTAGGEHPFLFSQCQAIHARSIFPCQDTPGVRFTYSAIVHVPAPLIAAMAAAPGDSTFGPEGNRFTFFMPQPVPAYLFALAVGNLTSQDISPRCRIYAEPESIDAAAWEFAETETAIQYAEELFGPYPWDRYDLLLMPPSFPFGGMENPRLNFLTPTLLAGDRSLTNVVTHELAHSWTGNLVTNATWADFWLNEGWTVYGERRILESQYGREFANLASALGRRQLIRGMERFGMDSDGTRLVRKIEAEDPDRPNFLVPYEKGYAFLARVEQLVGREVFDPFIIKYLEKFRFSSITTADFLDFLLKEIPQVEKLLDIQEWIYGTGLPKDAPVFASARLDEVIDAVSRFSEGWMPSAQFVQDWGPTQIDIFLGMIPDTLAENQAQGLYELFGLAVSKNYENLASFYPLAIRSGYEQVLPRIEEFLARIGRMKLIGPIYLALAETDWSKSLALPMFEKYKAGYHPIAERGLSRFLQNAGVKGSGAVL